MLNRSDLITLIRVDVRELLGCVEATDSEQADKLKRDIEAQMPYLHSASTEQLKSLVLTAAQLDAELWEEPYYEDLQDAAEVIKTERRHAEGQAREGIQQTRMF